MKKLDFLSDSIINKFKRSSLSVARDMLQNGKNISNIKILHAISDIEKLKLLVEFGLSVNTVKTMEKESPLHKNNYKFHILDKISNEKLKFLIEHNINFSQMSNGHPLFKLYKSENLKTFLEYMEQTNEINSFIVNNQKFTLPHFIKNCIIDDNIESLKIITSYVRDPDIFYKLAIEEGVQHLKLDSLYLLYQKNIMTFNYLQENAIYDKVINELQKEIQSRKSSIEHKKSHNFFTPKFKESLSVIKQKSSETSKENHSIKELELCLNNMKQAFKNEADFNTYFTLREKQELDDIMGTSISAKKKRL